MKSHGDGTPGGKTRSLGGGRSTVVEERQVAGEEACMATGWIRALPHQIPLGATKRSPRPMAVDKRTTAARLARSVAARGHGYRELARTMLRVTSGGMRRQARDDSDVGGRLEVGVPWVIWMRWRRWWYREVGAGDL
uniref:Uncharacterized protein n=1 Tax=Oryza nivara TaxID=4536 RepID=A0A0E0GAF5_ORYNI